jgi:hypothetical protein
VAEPVLGSTNLAKIIKTFYRGPIGVYFGNEKVKESAKILLNSEL